MIDRLPGKAKKGITIALIILDVIFFIVAVWKFDFILSACCFLLSIILVNNYKRKED